MQEMEYASLRKIVEERDIATSLKRAGKRAECKICGVSPRVVKGHRAPGHFAETSDAASQCRETRVELGAFSYAITTPRLPRGETAKRSGVRLSASALSLCAQRSSARSTSRALLHVARIRRIRTATLMHRGKRSDSLSLSLQLLRRHIQSP